MGFKEEEKLLSITKALGWLEMEGKPPRWVWGLTAVASQGTFPAFLPKISFFFFFLT